MNKEIVWIYDRDIRKFRRLSRTDPRLDWEWEYTPRDRVKFGKRRWRYCPWGRTAQEAADKENAFRYDKIGELKEIIQALESEPVRVPE